MSRKHLKSLVCIVLVLILGLCNLTVASAETYYSGTLHEIGPFSFTDYTISSSKHIEGRYIAFRIDFYKPYWDSGLGDILLKFEVRDAYTGQAITTRYVLGPTGSAIYSDTFYYVDLGYAGRDVEFWFDASSAGTSNGNFRSATVELFRIYIY